MSGGLFNYKQFVIDDIADKIDAYVNGEEICNDDVDYYCQYCDEESAKYIRENKRTLPNEYNYSKGTLEALKQGIKVLRQAAVYAHHIDKLLSGDYGEEEFKSNLGISLLKCYQEE